VPPLQLRSVGQSVPHEPQLLSSSDKFTQASPQSAWPAGQTRMQLRPTHVRPEAHVVPQPPQLASSSSRLTQFEPHSVSPAVHTRRQMPDEHD
jgi:hypothetical protein